MKNNDEDLNIEDKKMELYYERKSHNVKVKKYLVACTTLYITTFIILKEMNIAYGTGVKTIEAVLSAIQLRIIFGKA